MILKAYDTEINGHPTTLLLTAADAKARGLTDPPAEQTPEEPAAASKQRPAANKAISSPNNK